MRRWRKRTWLSDKWYLARRCIGRRVRRELSVSQEAEAVLFERDLEAYIIPVPINQVRRQQTKDRVMRLYEVVVREQDRSQ